MHVVLESNWSESASGLIKMQEDLVVSVLKLAVFT
jgi:hypothetical protein